MLVASNHRRLNIVNIEHWTPNTEYEQRIIFIFIIVTFDVNELLKIASIVKWVWVCSSCSVFVPHWIIYSGRVYYYILFKRIRVLWIRLPKSLFLLLAFNGFSEREEKLCSLHEILTNCCCWLLDADAVACALVLFFFLLAFIIVWYLHCKFYFWLNFVVGFISCFFFFFLLWRRYLHIYVCKWIVYTLNEKSHEN